MRPYMILLVLPVLLLAATDNKNLAWVDKQIEAIKPNRSGLGTQATTMLRDPFIDILKINRSALENPDGIKEIAKVQVVEQKPLSLQAIMNGRSAMIDGKWYKVEEKIHGYTIKKNRTYLCSFTKPEKAVEALYSIN